MAYLACETKLCPTHACTSEVGLACETIKRTGKLGILDLTFRVLLGPGSASTAAPQTTLQTARFRAAAFTQFTLRSCRYCSAFNTYMVSKESAYSA